MKKIRIKNWEKYQQYKDRNPTWVKLHRKILTSQDWVMLDNDGRALMIALMMMACTCDDGLIPYNEDYICRVAYFNKIDLNPLLSLGFIETICDDTEVYENVSKDTESVSVSVSVSNNKIGKKTKNVYSNEFSEFWKLYPPNNAGKYESLKSYNRARKETDHETIIRSARNYAEFCSKSGTFIAHATTWLNQKRWEVDYTTEIINSGRTPTNRKSNFDDVMAAAARVAARETSPKFSDGEDILH